MGLKTEEDRFRRLLAKDNTRLAIFSFSAAGIVYLVSDLENLAVMASAAEVAALIMFLLLVFQSAYHALLSKRKLPHPTVTDPHDLQTNENTYFIALAAAASASAYAITALAGQTANSLSALAACVILGLLLLFQIISTRVAGSD